MNYQMRIVLESDMCMGSGESKGNAVDLDICTDTYGVPYIPARRLKGCLRQTAEFLLACKLPCATEENIKKLFGNSFGTEGLMIINDAKVINYDEIVAAICDIRKSEKDYLRGIVHPENIERLYTAVRGQTRLRNGLKVDGTLRFTRVLLKNNSLFNEKEPVAFQATVSIADDQELDKLFRACCDGTRHIGSNRNRGLGNITIEIIDDDKDNKMSVDIIEPDEPLEQDIEYCMAYKIGMDSPVTIPDFGGNNTMIPSRSVIGCLGGYYAKNHAGEDKRFEDLFLNGTVCWSALTPVIKGKVSTVTPNYVMKLKNGNGKLINLFAQKDENWKRLKPKTIEGSYASETDQGMVIADVRTRAQYHNSMSKEMLYTQESIEPGYIYGGTVTFRGKYYRDIMELLTSAMLRFGRSRNIQYANCHLISIEKPTVFEKSTRMVSGKIYLVLNSDLIAIHDGRYISENKELRDFIVKQTGIMPIETSLDKDSVCYGMIGGFQNLWHLQKMQIPIVKAGSVLVFDTKDVELPWKTQIGSYKQEGFGNIRIITEQEMQGITTIQHDEIDILQNEGENEIANQFKNLLTMVVVKETLLRYARNYKTNVKRIPISRLRLMLQNSESYQDFMKKVDTIKESDVSSENTGRKQAAKDFLREFYGEKDIRWKKLLSDEPELFEEIEAHPDLKKEVQKMWHLPLITVLHNMHYEKGGK